MTRPSALRADNINIRVHADKLGLIDRAARAVGKTRSAFVLDSATKAAEETLLDSRVFVVDEATWNAFTAALDEPPSRDELLRAFLVEKQPWDRA